MKVSPKISSALTRIASGYFMILLFLLALFIALCLVSYSPDDPGWSHSKTNSVVENLGGVLGAYIADIGLQGFGFSVYLIPITIALFGWNYCYRWKNNRNDHLFGPILFFLGFVVAIVGASGLESLYSWYETNLSNSSSGVSFPNGGVLGYEISKLMLSLAASDSNLAVSQSRSAGTNFTTALFLVLVVVGTWCMGLISWLGVAERVGRGFFWIISRKIRPAEQEEPVIEKTKEPRKSKFDIRKKKTDIKGETAVVEPSITGILSESSQPVPQPPPQKPKTPAPENRKPKNVATAPQARPRAKTATGKSLPDLSLLDHTETPKFAYSKEELMQISSKVEDTLRDFKLEVVVKSIHPGPVVTQLEIEPAAGLKSSQIVNLSKDLARSLAVPSIRIADNVPGSPYVGVEIPNKKREVVRLIDGLESSEYKNSNAPLTVALGKNIGGATVVSNLAKMPHLLIAGTTGAGKSVCLNAILLSLLYKSTADQVRLIMVDPKMLEFSVYEGIPHLLAPVITDMQKTENALRWCVVEVERRFRIMAELGTRNLESFNEKIKNSAEPILDPSTADSENPENLKPFPYVVFVIDELADLIMVLGRKAEELIIRIAQKARAAGVHLIVATQRPSSDVIRGILKANIPTRIGFKVASGTDSRTILDQGGAETLLGQGDMLFIPPGSGTAIRVHGAFVSDDEVKRVVDFLKTLGEPRYNSEVTEDATGSSVSGSGMASVNGDDYSGQDDELYNNALYFVAKTRRATISSVQRHLRIGYNRAARIIEAMEEAGAISQVQAGGKREVFVEPPDD